MFQSALADSQAGTVIDMATLKAEFIANGYVVKLFKNGFAPTPLSVAADFNANECDFNGYASKSIGGAGELFVGPMLNAQNQVVLATPSMTWIATDDLAPNSVGGFWVENTAHDIRRYGTYPQPVDMSLALDFLDMQIFESVATQGYVDVDN